MSSVATVVSVARVHLNCAFHSAIAGNDVQSQLTEALLQVLLSLCRAQVGEHGPAGCCATGRATAAGRHRAAIPAGRGSGAFDSARGSGSGSGRCCACGSAASGSSRCTTIYVCLWIRESWSTVFGAALLTFSACRLCSGARCASPAKEVADGHHAAMILSLETVQWRCKVAICMWFGTRTELLVGAL